MYFAENLKFLRKRIRKSQMELATELGLTRTTLSGYEKSVQPPFRTLIRIAEYFNISLDALIKYRLSVLSEFQLSQIEKGLDVDITGNKLRLLTISVDNEGKENIEMVPVKAQAGYTNGFSDPEYISELQVFQMPFLSKEKKYRTFQLQGDSMLPIPEKAWVTGEYVQDWFSLKTGQACVVLTINDGIVFKIIENRFREEGRIILYSLNPLYEPYILQATEIREIWRFVNFISHEIPEPILPENELVRTVAGLKQDMDQLKMKLEKGGEKS